MIFYDRAIYLSCIVYLPAFKGFQDEVVKFLEENFQAKQLNTPMSFASEVAKEMSNAGYPRYAKLPVQVSSEEALVLLARCLKKFNNSAAVRTQPVAARVNREVTKDKDFARIVNELLLQQDNISLSQIWGTNDMPKVVYTDYDTPLNGRLSRTVISEIQLPANESKKKQQLEFVLDALGKQVQEAIVLDRKQEESNYISGKYQL